MPKVSRESAEVEDVGIVVDRHGDVDGYTVNFVTFREDLDATPLLRGAPHDQCQCPHWGYVTKGRLTYRFADREEVVEAGEAFYLPSGHIPVQNEPGSEFVQFSPTKELLETQAVMRQNMEAMQAG
jgi:mannose-6-phosphate isomerase-like protein (cupin superfamily)